ncbi:hypothetical protein PG995_002208 [Apiospora arundinis]
MLTYPPPLSKTIEHCPYCFLLSPPQSLSRIEGVSAGNQISIRLQPELPPSTLSLERVVGTRSHDTIGLLRHAAVVKQGQLNGNPLGRCRDLLAAVRTELGHAGAVGEFLALVGRDVIVGGIVTSAQHVFDHVRTVGLDALESLQTTSVTSVITARIIVADSGAVGRCSLDQGISSGVDLEGTIINRHRRSDSNAEAKENGSKVKDGLHGEHVALCHEIPETEALC